jgi:hypothetical protein
MNYSRKHMASYPGRFWSLTYLHLTFQSLLLTWYTVYKFNIQQLCILPALYLCALYLYENSGLCPLHNKLNVFLITEMKSVYSAVRTGSLNKAIFHLSLKG